MFARPKELTQRLLGGVDLLIDFATLGAYGLEPVATAAGAGREGYGREADWEALAPARRGGYEGSDGESPFVAARAA